MVRAFSFGLLGCTAVWQSFPNTHVPAMPHCLSGRRCFLRQADAWYLNAANIKKPAEEILLLRRFS